ncbi:AlpA family transcriptional regulator [Vibrio sp. TBV020]|uniref:AlpA family transcriptional regulator n=1 Tax=Vibrio sp. TBV020 TaxID=3137398 RepID=UPI0038CD7AC0
MKILRLQEVIHKTSLSRSAIYQRMKDGNFPKKLNLGRRSVGWLEEDIDVWILKTIAESRAQSSLEVSIA